MYLTPNMLWKTFDWQRRTTGQDSRGRPVPGWSSVGQIRGIISDSSPEEKLRYQQMQHPITHEIAVQGSPQAAPGDLLVLDGRHFFIQDVQDPGGLGMWTLYKVEERRDV
ncbi:MAG: phage head closure protein [Alicyclobacillus macrosporangiidus]|uniref:phage head closure protein n=1 Tax=Alicyclobacillus macrosporangiidus TaxID=392015 RepID=UPI0026F36838|nr:phage head closure protein [Alicyclobacillus macrosporangiidus]MCL6597946.1 phage head closure protein [Alicyclobacillus macrosporangiidus]